MTTYRITRATSSINAQSFASYNDALEYNRANGLQARPIRRIEAGRIKWTVPSVAKAQPLEVVKLPDWHKPSWYDSPCHFEAFKPVREAPAEVQPMCHLSQWDEASQCHQRPPRRHHR